MKHFTQFELAKRWSMSARTLERWRWLGQGPRFLKVGKRVVYPEAEVIAYEAGQLHDSTRQLSQRAS
jgi:hypothetical protein